MSYRLTAAQTLPVDAVGAYRAVLHCDLRQMFDRRYLVLAPIAAYETTPSWPDPGAQRSIRATDGSTFCETISRAEHASLIEYTMTEIGGPLRFIASEILNRWTFDPHPSGTRVAWTWEVTAPNRASEALEPLFRPQWGRYARRAMERLETVASTDGAR